MPRRGSRGHSHHHGHGGKNDLVTLTADRILREDFDRQVKMIHIMTGLLAERLRDGGDLAQALENDTDFIQEQKNRLIALAETNAQQMQFIHDFKDALNQVRDKCVNDDDIENNNDDVNHDGSKEDETSTKDYGKILEDFLHKNGSNKRKQQNNNFYRGKFVRTIRTKLGEQVTKDTDLEMVMPSSSEENSMKCPIKGTLFEDPVINMICKHTYDRDGLVHHRKSGKSQCPIPGCPNSNLDQIEDDIEMKLKVQQYNKRLQRIQRAKEEEVDDTNILDEEEETDNNDLTVIH